MTNLLQTSSNRLESTTAIHNACDRQVLFREAKKKVHKVLSSQVDFSNSSLEAYLKKSFESMLALFPRVSMTSEARATLIEGLCCLVYVIWSCSESDNGAPRLHMLWTGLPKR